MSTISLLKTALVEVGVLPTETSNYFLSALDSTLLAPGGVDVMNGDERTARLPKLSGCSEVSKLDVGLRTLVLLNEQDSEVTVHAILDGWRLLRRRGTGADLAGADLRGADLTDSAFAGANLVGARLTGACLEGADLTGANLTGADLAGAVLRRASLFDANLSEADLRRTDLRHSDLRQSTCVRTAFRGADFWSAYVWDVNFDEAFTDGAEIERADYRGTNLAKPAGART